MYWCKRVRWLENGKIKRYTHTHTHIYSQIVDYYKQRKLSSNYYWIDSSKFYHSFYYNKYIFKIKNIYIYIFKVNLFYCIIKNKTTKNQWIGYSYIICKLRCCLIIHFIVINKNAFNHNVFYSRFKNKNIVYETWNKS